MSEKKKDAEYYITEKGKYFLEMLQESRGIKDKNARMNFINKKLDQWYEKERKKDDSNESKL